jgi:mono/diheme cytochrome c family protein
MSLQRPAARRIAGALLLILGAAATAGCDDDDAGRFRSEAGVVPETSQREGDPAAGYDALVNEDYVSCGLPYDAWRRLNPEVDPADLIPGRRGRNAELPYAATATTTAEGVEVVASNCLVCHAARFEGELIVGLGNEFLDFTQDASAAATSAGAYVRGEAETAAWRHWAERIEGVAPYIRTSTVGVNPATNLTWALMSRLDPETLEWADAPLIEPPPREPLPVSVPPWWRMQKKHAMFYTTIGRGDHARFMMLASLLCVDSVEEVEAIDAYGPDIRAWIASLEAPEYPHPIDAALAEEGRAIFEKGCSGCHGTYGEAPSYPNKLIPLGKIGTDPEYARAATDGRRDRFYEWVEASWFGSTVETAPAPGYVAPPLDGVWATAPYLHNGSVPDVATLLDSAKRPRFWRHAPGAPEFDQETLGWRYERLEAGKDAAETPEDRARIYDTTRTGYGAGGHTYGDLLSEAERRALIEYLKTL